MSENHKKGRFSLASLLMNSIVVIVLALVFSALFTGHARLPLPESLSHSSSLDTESSAVSSKPIDAITISVDEQQATRLIVAAPEEDSTAVYDPPKDDSPGGGELFGDVLPTIEETLNLRDIHDSLPSWSVLSRNKRSNQNQISDLLDRAIDILNISPINNDRKELRGLQDKIKQGKMKIATYREKQISAPRSSEVGLLGKLNPMLKTQGRYDQLIRSEEDRIIGWEMKAASIQADFIYRMRQLGLDIDYEAAESLLNSVIGDDFIQLSIVFNNLKKVTSQLQELTEETGESLGIAKRYYGLYVILNEVLDRMQKQFIRSIHDQHIPRLHELIGQAQRNIHQAELLLRQNNTNRETLHANIESNSITVKAARYYVDYLLDQAAMVQRDNEDVEQNLAAAWNTYQTVKVSSHVAELIQRGNQQFNALMRLKMPVLREFENQVIRQEFLRLTDQIEIEPEGRATKR